MWHGQPRFHAKGTISVIRDMLETNQLMAAIDKLLVMGPRVEVDWQELATFMMQKLTPRHYENFIRDPNIRAENIPPDIENTIMAQGRVVQVSQANDHNEHQGSHVAHTKTPDYQGWPRRQQANMELHIQQHGAAMVAAQQQQQRPAQQGPVTEADSLRGVGAGAGGVQ